MFLVLRRALFYLQSHYFFSFHFLCFINTVCLFLSFFIVFDPCWIHIYRALGSSLSGNCALCKSSIIIIIKLFWGNGVTQLVERRTQDQKIPSGAQEKFVWVVPSQKCSADSLSVCPTARVHNNYTHARIRIITSEICGFAKTGCTW